MPRARSADVPRYDTYPAPTPSEAAATPQDWPYEPKTDVDLRTQCGNPRLNETAEQIGETLGRAVALARSVPRRVEHIKDRFAVVRGGAGQGPGLAENVKQRAGELRDEARARMQDLRTQVQDRLDDARATARERIEEARSIARDRLAEARERARLRAAQARQYAHDNPLQVIGGAALAGLALGVGLRLWRSSHDER